MKVSELNTHHPSYDRAEIDVLDALHEGGKLWRALLSTWLPQSPVEPQDLYNERKARANYTNHLAPNLALTSARVMAPGAAVDGMADDAWKRLASDADGAGGSWLDLWTEILGTVLLHGRSLVWVDAPQAPVGEDGQPVQLSTFADAEYLGLTRTYLRQVTPASLIDWDHAETGRLSWVMLHEVSTDRTSPTAPRRRAHTWTAIDAQQVRRWRWVQRDANQPDPRPDDEAPELPATPHGFGEIPVVELVVPSGLCIGHKLRDPSVAHIRLQNDLRWSLYRAMHALLCIVAKNHDDRPSLGAGYHYQLFRDQDGADSASYAEPSGANITLGAAEVREAELSIYRVLHHMALTGDASAGDRQRSGESKTMDWQPSTLMLRAYAKLLRTAMRNAARLLDAPHQPSAGGKPVLKPASEYTVVGLEGYERESNDDFLLQAAQSMDAREISPSFRRAVAMASARRLLADEVSDELMAAISAEIEAWAPPPDPWSMGA